MAGEWRYTGGSLIHYPTPNASTDIDEIANVQLKGKTMNAQKLGKDNWLFILTNAIANYADAGGEVAIYFEELTGSMKVVFEHIEPDDSRLNGAFVALVDWQDNAEYNETDRWIDDLINSQPAD
jgi:hypothetical protein